MSLLVRLSTCFPSPFKTASCSLPGAFRHHAQLVGRQEGVVGRDHTDGAVVAREATEDLVHLADVVPALLEELGGDLSN